MQEFESIRPYRDEEVPEVAARLLDDPGLIGAAAGLFTPRLAAVMPGAARLLASLFLRRRVRGFQSIDDVQLFLAAYFERLIRETIAELTVSGLAGLDRTKAYLFISNHRDILMDTGLVNFTLHRAGHRTPEAAVGDNLLSEPLVADLMRLNKSFVVERSVTGKRAVYAALTRTSNYIRHVLESGHSVWIAQREGRAKNGFDRTDPALLKMLALAWRKDLATFDELVTRIAVVPVAISYELDPCDQQKAHELAVLAREGAYRKAPGEDLSSMVAGMTGFKGRVHVHYGAPLEGRYETSEAMAEALDRAIVGGLKVFPTQAEAARELGFAPVPDTPDWLAEVRDAFDGRLARCPDDERPFLLSGYGNVIRNRAELGLTDPPPAASLPLATGG